MDVGCYYLDVLLASTHSGVQEMGQTQNKLDLLSRTRCVLSVCA